MGLYDFTFYDVINRNAICYRDKNAWFDVDDNRSLTFLQYQEEVNKLAAGLQKFGIRKGDRIGILGKNSLEYFLLYGASAALGAIVVPINWRLSADEVVYNLNDCTPRIVFVDEAYQEMIEVLKGKLPFVEYYFSLGSRGGHLSDFKTLLDHGVHFERPELANDDGFVIIYTAAVTGRPRGALLSHDNVLCTNMHLDYSLNITERDVHLNLLPLFHVAGLLMTTASFHVGARTLNMKEFDASKALEIIQEKKASIMLVFPPILSSIIEQQEKSGMDIASLRAVTGLDAQGTIEKYQKITGGHFYCAYGQTEASGIVTLGRYDERPGSAGKMLPLSEVRLIDDYDRVVPTGQVGEIAIRGPLVFKGYWNIDDDNAYTFREGWHHTGDLGSFDEGGFLWYEGRRAEKELIKPGGENVYPAEVEKVILEHGAVEETVVIGVPDSQWGEAIKAICVLKEGASLTESELIEFVAARIARYKKPKYVVFSTTLPKDENGLIDRGEIKKIFVNE